MGLIFFDDSAHLSLLPLTFTRPVAQLRVGILTIAEKWETSLGGPISYYTQPYLEEKFPARYEASNLFIKGSVCPDSNLLEAVNDLREGDALYSENRLLALRLNESSARVFNLTSLQDYQPKLYRSEVVQLAFPEDLFKWNDLEICKDYHLITKNKSSQALSSTNRILGDNIFVEEGVEAECATFNSLQGPVYLGKNSQVWEGANIRGSFALCEGAQVKMGAKIYPATTIGPYSKVGGELSNTVILDYSAKAHEGYLGNSVLGAWCNLGADTTASNLKNNYSEVKLWDYNQANFRNTHLQFCGLIMADHAKCSINTMFNTGTVVGVGAHVFGTGFPKKFIPDFTWGGGAGWEIYRLEKMFETATKVLKRRALSFEDADRKILSHVFDLTTKYRLL